MDRTATKSKKRHREKNPNLIAVQDPAEAPKAKRQFTEQDHKLSNVYERLADDTQAKRLQAAKELLADLFPGPDPASADAIEKAVRRLVRGLCSSRKAARYGFFVALTEVLRQAYASDITIQGLLPLDVLMQIVVDSTKAGSQATGQERRDHIIGRMYAFKSIIESGAAYSNSHFWSLAVDNIVDLAVKTPWLREECGVVLIEAIRAVGGRANSKELVRIALDALVKKQLWKTPEGVAIWLTVKTSQPEFSSYPENIWINDDPLDQASRKTLYRTMREQFQQTENEEQKSDKSASNVKGGFWQQSVHTAWEVVFETAVIRGNETYVTLWQNLVDEGLFEAKASVERKFWGFQLFTKMVKTAPQSLLTNMLSPNFLSQLLTSLSRKNHMLHEGALDATRKIKTRAKQEPETTNLFVLGLLGKHGSLLFDRHTKSKTVEELMACADTKAFVKIVDALDSLISDQKDKDTEEEAESERTILADILLTGLKAQFKENARAVEPKSIKRVLGTLVKYAYCKPRSGAATDMPLPALSSKSRAVFHDRLSSILGLLINEGTEDSDSWSWYAVDRLHAMTKSSKEHELALDAEKDIRKTIKNAFSVARDMERQTGPQSSESAILLLYSLALLQAYSGDADAVDLLSELNVFFASSEEQQTSENKYDQILEILLSFVSKPSQLYRKLANEVFPTIAAKLTEDGLQSLYAILEQPETLTGQGELFDKVEEAEEAESDASDSELDSDVEMINGTNGHNDDSDAESSSNSSEDEDDDNVVDDDDEPDEELTQFEAKLAEALKTSSATNGNDDDESDDASMNDEEMMAIEPKLAAVFRERQKKVSKPKEQKRAKEHVINFKRRVLDLLKLYIKQQSASDLSLSMILPLLSLLRSTKEKSLQNDAVEILKLHASTCQKAKLYPHANADTWTTLAAVHEEARQKVGGPPAGAHLHGAACSRASLFVARVLLREDKQNYERVADEYSVSMKKWFASGGGGGGGGRGGGGLQATFFTEFVSWSAEVRKTAV